MNYLKSRAIRLKERLDPEASTPAVRDEIERLQSEALAMKNRIVERNMALVIFVARKHVKAGEELSEFIAEGNLALIRAVDSFDFARGNRFSTYATWAIRNTLLSKSQCDRRQRGRPFVDFEESLMVPDPSVAEFESESLQDNRRAVVRRWFSRLNKRERWILTKRYGLAGVAERTLAQIGRDLGISKQRVSQLAARAENKLRKIARCETLEALGL
jgi:RNA polymerase primary sigma factor